MTLHPSASWLAPVLQSCLPAVEAHLGENKMTSMIILCLYHFVVGGLITCCQSHYCLLLTCGHWPSRCIRFEVFKPYTVKCRKNVPGKNIMGKCPLKKKL